MKAKRIELLGKVEGIGFVTAKVGLSPQCHCIALKDGRAHAFNDRMMASADVGIDVEGAVDADTLLRVLRSFQGEEVDVTAADGKLRLAEEDSRASIPLEEIVMPIGEVPRPKSWQAMPDGLAHAMAFASFSAARGSAHGAFCFVSVSRGMVVSAMEERATACKVPGNEAAFLISAEDAPHVPKDSTKMALSPGWVHFKNGAGTVTSSRIPGDVSFPDTSGLFRSTKTALPFEVPVGLVTALGQVETMLPGDDSEKRVSLSCAKGFLMMSAESPSISFKRRFKSSNRNFDIAGNPCFLKETLTRAESVVIVENKLLIMGDTFRHVVALNDAGE